MLARIHWSEVMSLLIGSLLFAIAAMLVFLCLYKFDERLTLLAGFLFALYIGLDDIATSLASITPHANLLGGGWNWDGKVFSLVLSAFVIVLFKLDRHAVGLTLVQKNAGASLIGLVAFTLASFSLGFVFKPSVPNLETIAFQLTMPGLAEELAYRGLAPAILLGLFSKKNDECELNTTSWVVIVITATAFGLWHGLSFKNFELSFNAMSVLFPLLGGIAYGWLRFKSGSLLLPVLAHGLGNTVFLIPSSL
jgi:uncharacterized protein